MAVLKIILRWTLRLFIYGIGTGLLLGVGLVLMAGFTSFGAQLIAPWLADLASRPDRQIAINDPGPLLTGKLRIPSITVADEAGVYAEARDVQMDWSPLSLLEGTFRAERLYAETVNVKRGPESNPPPTGDNGGISLPVEIDVGKFDLPSVAVGASVLGQAFETSASGRLHADSTTIATDLRIDRKDGVGGALDAILVFSPATDTLRLEAQLSEPQGGILARLLHVPDSPPISVEVRGEGPLSDWSGNVTAHIDGVRAANVQLRHKTMEPGEHGVTITGGGQLESLLPPFLRSAFSDETSIDLAVVYSDQGLRIDRTEIVTGDFLLTASGMIDRTGENDLAAHLVGVDGPIEFRWPIGVEVLAVGVNGLDLTANGPASAVRVKADFSFAKVGLPQATLEDTSISVTSESFDLSSMDGNATAMVNIGRAQFRREDLGRALRAPLKIEAPLAISPARIGFEGATIESASIGGSATGEYIRTDRTLDAHVQLFAVPGALPNSIGNRLTGMVEIEGDVSYRQPDAVTVSDLRIGSSAGSLSGDVSHAEGKLTATLAAQLSDLGLLITGAEGGATASLEATGPLDNLQGKLNATIAGAKFAGYELAEFALEAEGSLDPQSPTATLTGSGVFAGQPIDLATELQSENGETTLPELRVNVGSNTLSGSLSFTSDFRPEGSLQFDFPEVKLLAALAGQNIEGDLKGEIQLTSRDDVSVAQIAASGLRLSRETIEISEPSVSLELSDIGSPVIDGTINAKALSISSNHVENPTVVFDHAQQKTNFVFDARYDQAPLSAAGLIEQVASGIAIGIDRLTAEPRGIALQLQRPARLAFVDGNVTFEPLTIDAGGGAVTASGSVGDRLDVNVEARGLPAAFVNRFAPALSASGTISASAEARGSLFAPEVDYSLAWNDATIAQTRNAGLPSLTLAADGSLANQTLTLNAVFSGVAGLSVNGGGTIDLSGSRSLSMRFSGGLPFSLLAGRLSGQGLILEGSATMDVRVGGTTSAPAISGSIDAAGARLVDARRNITIEELNGRIVLSGNEARVENLRGRFAGGGSVGANGTVAFTDGNLPADLVVSLDRAAYADGTIFSTAASGTLNLRGSLLASPTLSGTVDLGETAITVPERLPPSLRQLEITHRNAPAAVQRQAAQVRKEESHGASSDIGLDLQVRAPARVFVRGRGIDAELGGALTIRGTATEPAVSGAFALVRGRLVILTRRLDFTSGTITFGGNLIPLLDLEATTTANNTTITVSVSGLADNPTVTFSSAPALPQDEILAQLIFGQSMTRLSPLQIAQLADAASQLAGGESTSLLEGLRSGLGVDNLDITTDAEGNAAVSAGKYLNDRTYLELQQSGSGTGKAIINLDIGKGLKLKGEASGDGGGGAGIFYEKEY